MVSRLTILQRVVLGGTERWTLISDQYAAREAWDRYGAGYDAAFSGSFTAFAREALRLADVRPGMTLLEVAAGGGALSIPAAELGAKVLATDLSPGMLALLRHRAADAGVSDVRIEVMYGTALDLDLDVGHITGPDVALLAAAAAASWLIGIRVIGDDHHHVEPPAELQG